jgi:hypothetical protein
MEKLMDKAKELLQLNLAATLADIDAGQGITTPDIPAANYYTTDLATRPNFPSCTIFSRRGVPRDQDMTVEEWQYTLEIEIYHTDIDQENLMRMSIRYAEAVKRILRSPYKWVGVGHSPSVSGIFYSNVIPDETGFMRACRVNVDIKAIEEFK